MQYDYLIVGSGLFGAVFAHQATLKGKTCLVIDKRNHVGGNIYCKEVEGIQVHQYGAHIFHTNSKEIWDFVNSFVPFNHFINSPIASYKSERFNLPVNMNTFCQVLGNVKVEEVKQKISEDIERLGLHKPNNLEEQAISMVGVEVYEKIIKGYTEKQWGRECKDLPASIIKRLPVRFTFDNNYFNDTFQGIPIGGYNKLTEGLLKGVMVQLDTDYFKQRDILDKMAKTIVFTGKIDEFYNYQFGELDYRSLRFEHETIDKPDYQGNAVVNYTEKEVPFTRIIEHRYFESKSHSKTVITKEYPSEWRKGLEPYYPINDERNMQLYKKYESLAKQETNIIFGGRLAEYKYYDMHQVIASALASAKRNVVD